VETLVCLQCRDEETEAFHVEENPTLSSKNGFPVSKASFLFEVSESAPHVDLSSPQAYHV